MNWLHGIQDSIDYIENHLDQTIDQADLASFLHVPYDTYQRIFTILCGVTPMQYIRFRRLSCAGVDVLEQSTSLLTIAISYGYETAESFTKAFTRFHQITPSQARLTQGPLRSFTRIKLSVSLQGASSLSYRIVDLPSFQVQAVRYAIPCDQAEYRHVIPQFWQDLFQTKTYQRFCSLRDLMHTNTHGAILGIDTIAYTHTNEDLYYFAALETTENIKNCEVLTIPSHTWAVFSCHGQMPQTIHSLWTQIYEEFFPHPVYEPLIEVHFEAYDPDHMDQAEIYIPIKKKGA